MKARLDEIHRNMYGVPNDPHSAILPNLRELAQSASEVRGSTADDFKKTLDSALTQFVPVALRQIKLTATGLTLLRDAAGAREAKEYLFALADLLDKILFSFNRLAALAVPKAEEGLLKDFLTIYENHRKSQGADGQEVFKHDELLNYFYVEVFDPANDKTIGSVKQTASNLTSLLSQAPFDKMFCPGGTFNFDTAIDQGRIVLLMLNFAKWQKSAKLASILYKLLFFRSALNRFKTLRADGGHLNRERTFFYLVDEFATVATRGEFTGESGFLDKCRQYQIACVLAFQSFARMRDAGVSQDYIDSVMGNCSIHFHLRNGDTSTAEYISKKGGLVTRAEGVLKGGTAESILQGETGGLREDSQMTYREQPRYTVEFISELNDGECIVRLSNQKKYRRRNTSLVQFLLHPLPRPSNHSSNKRMVS
ncbi:MAG: type IV secretory system conjugative DNA transfer family protein [Verrucomicrobiales bacterium]|nr:type IV secretory system conjugative DNA transfer family protein [Verrucomicrobiales bacterium]